MTAPARIATFVLGIVGSLCAGVGALLSWQTVTFQGQTVTKGVDTLAGLVALIVAVAALLCTLSLRVRDTEEPRAALLPLLGVAGVVLCAIGGLGVTGSSLLFDAAPEGDLATVRVGAGAWMAIVGGAAIILATVAGSAWARRWRATTDVADASTDAAPDPAGSEDPEP